MIARHLFLLLMPLVLGGCGPKAALLSALIPDGTTATVLGNLQRVEDQNRRRVLDLEAAKKWDELARFAEENIAKDRQNSEWWFVLGYARGQLKQHDAAAEAFASAVRFEPDNMSAWNSLGQSYRAAGDPRRAINVLNSALNVSRDSPVTLYLLGESYGDVQRHRDAAAAYREAVGLAPNFAAAWFSLARTYNELGRREDADAARARLEKLDPKLAAELK